MYRIKLEADIGNEKVGPMVIDAMKFNATVMAEDYDAAVSIVDYLAMYLPDTAQLQILEENDTVLLEKDGEREEYISKKVSELQDELDDIGLHLNRSRYVDDLDIVVENLAMRATRIHQELGRRRVR